MTILNPKQAHKTMAITKAEFLSKRAKTEPFEHELPDGDTILLRPTTAKLYRDYKRSLQDKNGDPILERQKYADELLIGRIVMNPDGSPMFSDEEIMDGIFDDLQMFPIVSLVGKAYTMLGLVSSGEGREKNSSTTDSTAPS